MKKDVVISIFEVLSHSLCVTSSDGQRIYDRLVSAMQAEQSIVLSFDKVTILTTTFLDAAIGQLYGVFNEEQIRFLLKVKNIQAHDLVLLKRVIETAKQYFKNRHKGSDTVKKREKVKNEDKN
ncbi:MAG: STAS-like domain-containing protein [Nitrosomonas sp.]|nr:STAS-like domain-containing protein [Nitrosomonas sp.]MDP1950042.1 STAS-like domain-containing protein [Nitrosomonas sp.]